MSSVQHLIAQYERDIAAAIRAGNFDKARELRHELNDAKLLFVLGAA